MLFSVQRGCIPHHRAWARRAQHHHQTLERKTTNHRRRLPLTLLLSFSWLLSVAVVVGMVVCRWLWWLSVVAQCLGTVVDLLLAKTSLTV